MDSKYSSVDILISTITNDEVPGHHIKRQIKVKDEKDSYFPYIGVKEGNNEI